MTTEDEKFERIAQRHIADLKKSSKVIVEDAAVRAVHKVMAEFDQGAHTEAKIKYHTTMIQCPHCDGSVRVPVQPYPDNFIDALKYDVAKRDSEAQQQEPVADSKAPMLSDWLQANYEADEIDEAAEELRRLFRENQLLWKEREEPHRQLEFYIRECNRLESERDAALTQPSQSQSDVKPWVPATTWRGLTPAEAGALWKVGMTPHEFSCAIEAKLKEKNAAPCKPLTDEEALNIARTFGAQPWPPGSCVAFARAIEAAHGIIGEQK